MTHTWTNPTGKYSTLYKDMLDQQHLMIAGAAGSGKSVVINALIYTALYKFPYTAMTENNCGFILIDPKRVELSAYKDLPHTIRYASEPSEILSALNLAMNITESRYKEMQARGEKKYSGGHIYVIIDEFADLMTTDRRHVQPVIQRLAQIGRAANVHIILATQCPLAKVIPTEIKVNFDAILGLRTATKRHSVNIVDVPGCETFPDPKTEGKAWGYYRKGASLTLYDLPMISADDLSARIKFWVDQKPVAPAKRLKKGLLSALFGRR